jgi:hypothetical protein
MGPRRRAHRQLDVAVFVDVDGTLVGPYRRGARELRPSAVEALAMLAEVAPVFLWSIAGPENGERLLEEFPSLSRHIAGAYGKSDFPLETVSRPFAIDDEAIDPAVLSCRHFILDSSYFGGTETEDLHRAASAVVAEIGPSSRARRRRRGLAEKGDP